MAGGMTLGGTTITGTGLAGAGIFAASSYAVVRMGDDIEAAFNDRQRSLLTQGLDRINGYISSDPRTLTDNQIVSTDLAMFVVEVSAGFGYVVRGKQVLQQTENASRGGGIAASVSDHVDDSGKYAGELAELVAGIRKIEATLDGQKGTTWLRKIANEAELFDDDAVVRIIDVTTREGLDTFKSAARRLGGENADVNANAFYANDGVIYLRRSRGNNIFPTSLMRCSTE